MSRSSGSYTRDSHLPDDDSDYEADSDDEDGKADMDESDDDDFDFAVGDEFTGTNMILTGPDDAPELSESDSDDDEDWLTDEDNDEEKTGATLIYELVGEAVSAMERTQQVVRNLAPTISPKSVVLWAGNAAKPTLYWYKQALASLEAIWDAHPQVSKTKLIVRLNAMSLDDEAMALFRDLAIEHVMSRLPDHPGAPDSDTGLIAILPKEIIRITGEHLDKARQMIDYSIHKMMDALADLESKISSDEEMSAMRVELRETWEALRTKNSPLARIPLQKWSLVNLWINPVEQNLRM